MPQLNKATLLNAQMKASIGNYINGAILMLLISLLFYIALYQFQTTNITYLNIWLLVQLLLCLILVLLSVRYCNHFDDIKAIWRNWIEIPFKIIAGLSWGLGWVLFVDPNNLSSMIILNTYITGMLAVCTFATPLDQRATNACIFSCALPLIIKATLIGSFFFIWIAFGASILTIAFYFFSVKLNKLYLTLLLQDEKNTHLIEALKTEKQHVEKISQEKTRFLAAASHDLRQPIQAINLFENVLASLLTQEDQKEILTKIKQSNQNLSDLLEPLLDISKLDSGIVKASPKMIHIDDVFYRIEQQNKILAHKHHIDLRCISTSQKAFIDEKKLLCILNNLVSNAIQYMGRKGKILLGVRRQSQGFRIEVWDNGQGIPESQQQNIFDEFYQVGNPERNRNKGLGLGLSIVKRLSKVIACPLSFHSHFGKGCYFALSFPAQTLIEAPIAQTERPIEASKQAQTTPLNRQYHVLIIEDDSIVAEALNHLITSWGFKTQMANNSTTALASLKKSIPDIILSDYQLQQGETGLDIITMIKQQTNKFIPALLLTGNTNKENIKIFQTQAYPILYKPIQPEVLKSKIMALL